MKKLRRKQIFTPVGATRWNGEIGTSAWALAFPSEWLPSPLRELEGAVLGDFLNLQLGVSQPHVWVDWTDSLDSTSCRRFVIDLASLRRGDGEGSPCQRWGLGFSVESKERGSGIKEIIQIIRRNHSVHSKAWLAFDELKVQKNQRNHWL